MNDILPYIYYSLPWLFVIGLSLAAVLGIGVGMVWPRFLVYPYLLVFFWVNSTSYGNLAVFASRSIYSRGSGMLFFGVVLWYVLGAWLCARMAASFNNNVASGPQPQDAPACNLRPWFLAWTVLLAAHVGVGLATGVPLAASLAPSGFSNIVWMAPLISLMLLAFRTREQALELARFIMLAGLARALFGLGRWAAAGGDPNNVYANMNAIQIRLTFFDINDSLLCTLAFAIAAVALFQAPSGAALPAPGRPWRALAWATLVATTLCVVLSYRRTAWIGLLLAFAVVLLRFPPARRLQLGLAAMPLAGAAMAFVAARRLAQTRAEGGSRAAGGLLHDMQSRRFGPESERVLELKLAFADFLAHPLAGIGAWGRYHGYQAISWQGNPDGGLFLHSGVLHIALKSGLIGTVLLAGTIVAFVVGARRALRSLPPELLGLGAAGAAGLAFMIPDLLIGTPFPQVRTTQMLALCLSLPYLALAAAQGPTALQRPAWQRAPQRQPVPA
ncbi:O-antigen ligase family protein [Massilia sp. CFBP9012]|uniref:O-antigen ligase family protein n=1 Tax=Massilia sp. CFBP9012 TaxID=3096531 RepID=UPI002A6A15C5|nr:O-antigen ligase family protein [Massilia sp. CFBP9012]MDY0976372.1 O-antigen ligase family protein [Massilia sp. CFBP9012]